MTFGDYLPTLFPAIVVLFIAGALLPLAFRNPRREALASFVPAAVSSLLATVLSASVLLSGSVFRFSSPIIGALPSMSLSFYVDGITAFFMLIIGLVSTSVSIYSLGYAGSYSGKHSIRALGSVLNVFVLSMLLVTATNNAFSFLLFWELMSLTSFLLVVYEHEKETNLRSGITYLVMTHIGTAFITAAFLVLYFQTGSLSFDSFRSAAGQLSPFTKDVVFVLALAGFGTKAGLVPMHIWLPKAHPSAPSNVSALMSGVMLKVGIYGLVRVTLDFVVPSSPGDAWLGLLMVAAGSSSALIGVLYASVEHDIKRALAYHSVENIGIIVLGLGLSVVFMSYGLETLAALALLASMYHSLNHAVFKGLLFMGAGSVLMGAGTADMNQMGGLAKRMPWTALFFLVGSIAIAGLPPLNGFVSEWLTMQALLSSYQVPNVVLQLSIGFASIAFALTLGLASATFVKLFGISFLSRPRSRAAEEATEAPRSMIAGMTIAGSMCVVLGVLPFVATSAIASAFGFDTGLVSSYAPFGPLTVGYSADGLRSVSSLSMPTVLVLIGSAGAALLGFVTVAGSGRRTITRRYTTWEGGFGALDERTEYTATSLSQPIRTVFKSFFRPHTSVKREFYSDSNHFIKRSVSVTSETREVFEDYLYSPALRAVVAVLDRVRRLQTGKINAYLLYIMIATISLLVLVVIQR
jgi:hydrogenase-4 component B